MPKIKTREGTYDDAIVREMKVYDPLFQGYKGGTVMDVGANIGAFARRACQVHKAPWVTAYEPDPENFELLVHNCAELAVACFQKAIVNDDGRFGELWLNDGMNKAIHSTVPTRGRTSIVIKTEQFSRALKKDKPELVKVDIEGEEYWLEDLHNLPACVKAVAVELHLNRKAWREELAPKLVKSLKAQFPNVRKKPKIGEKNWTTMFIGAR